MSSKELAVAIEYELEALRTIVRELKYLEVVVRGREPSIREKTAAGAFLAQFYTGIENVLKRISYFYGVPLPSGDTWHLDLFDRFCEPTESPLPVLFDAALATQISPFRRFWHVVHHGYSFELEWDRMREGIGKVEPTFHQFEARLAGFLSRLS